MGLGRGRKGPAGARKKTSNYSSYNRAGQQFVELNSRLATWQNLVGPVARFGMSCEPKETSQPKDVAGVAPEMNIDKENCSPELHSGSN